MAETIDEITIDWTDEEGNLAIKELKKEVLTRGSWTTIMFLYQERDKRSGEYGSPKIRVARFQKRHGRFTPQSKFNISSLKQAKQFVDVLNQWMAEMGEAESGEEE